MQSVHLDDVVLCGARTELHGKALKIAESKEAYVNRKKQLAAKVRAFTKMYLSSDDATDDKDSMDSDWVEPCKSLIADFKADFDVITDSAKLSELCFMAVYKIINDLVDPKEIIQSCLAVCLRCHEALKNAVDQLANANTLLETQQHHAAPSVEFPRFGSSAHLDELSKLQDVLDKERTTKEQLQNDLAGLRNRLEIEMRTREQTLRASFEKHQLEYQQQMDYALDNKDEEIASLVMSLNDLRSRSLEADQRQLLLDNEINRRREVEDKLR
jgi:hypothetical protein